MGINTNAQFLSVVANTWQSLGVSNATVQQFGTLWPDDPADGSPHNTGDGTASTGFQDKRSVRCPNLLTESVTDVAGSRTQGILPLHRRCHSGYPIVQQGAQRCRSYLELQVLASPRQLFDRAGAYHLAEVPYVS